MRAGEAEQSALFINIIRAYLFWEVRNKVCLLPELWVASLQALPS